MRIDESKFKRCSAPASLAAEVRALLERAETMEEPEFLAHLESNLQWKAPKMELIVWARVLDRCDALLAQCTGQPLSAPSSTSAASAATVSDDPEASGPTSSGPGPCAQVGAQAQVSPWRLPVDLPDSPLRPKLRLVLAFVHELFENTTSRTCFASFERLIRLLHSSVMEVVHWVLTVVQTISRRTQLMAKLGEEEKRRLVEVVEAVGTPWEPASLSVAQWAQLTEDSVPAAAKALSFHYLIPSSSSAAPTSRHIRIPNVAEQGKSAGELMEELSEKLSLGQAGPAEEDSAQSVRLHAALRLASTLHSPRLISTSLIARLQALQILLYSGLLEDGKMSLLLPSNLLLQLVAVLKLTEARQRELQCETFRTLIAIIHYDRTNMLELLIAELSVPAFHGFLPSMVRERLAAMTGAAAGAESPGQGEENLTTAMMSFVYHLSNYEPGREALVASGLLQSLIAMVRWDSAAPAQMQFVTRSVRLIDIMLHSIHMPTFTALAGLPAVLGRLGTEVDRCRAEEPFVLGEVAAVAKDGGETVPAAPLTTPAPASAAHVLPKRAALIKSLQNFLKRVIATPNMGPLTSQMMNSSLPRSLAHIVSNQAYYGPALFLQSIELVTLFIQSQPSELTTLQERGLVKVVQTAILEREMPPNREFLCKLFPVLQALCTNARGLKEVEEAGVWEKALGVLRSPAHVSALKRGRRSEGVALGASDTASELGASADELIKHHQGLRAPAVRALIGVLRHLRELGSLPAYRAVLKPSVSAQSSDSATADPPTLHAPSFQPPLQPSSSSNPSIQPSEENSEDDMDTEEAGAAKSQEDAQPVPLPDFLANVGKFTDAFLGSSQHHHHHPVIPNQRSCEEFLSEGGGKLLVALLTLPNLPFEMAAQTSCMGPLTKLLVNLASFPRDTSGLTTTLCEGTADAVSALDLASSGPSTPDHFSAVLTSSSGPTTTSSVSTRSSAPPDTNSSTPTPTSEKSSDSIGPFNSTKLFYLSNHLSCLVKILGSGQRPLGSLKPWLKLLPVLPQLSRLYQLLEAEGEVAGCAEAQNLQTKLRAQIKDLLVGLSRMGQGSPAEELVALGGGGRRLREAIRSAPSVESIAIVQKLWTSLSLGKDSAPALLRSQLRLYTQLLFGEGGNGKPAPATLRSFNDTGALSSLFAALQRAAQQRLALQDKEAVEELECLVEAALCLVLKLVDPAHILLPASANQVEPGSADGGLSASETSLRFLKVAQNEAIQLSSEISEQMGVWERSGVVESLLGMWSVVLESRAKVEELEEEVSSARNPRRAAERQAEEAAEWEAMVEPEALQALMDMGFQRPAALAALGTHGSLDAAAEWLLTRPPPPAQPRAAAAAQGVAQAAQASAPDEEEQLRQAIQLSISASTLPTSEGPAADPTQPLVPQPLADAQAPAVPPAGAPAPPADQPATDDLD